MTKLNHFNEKTKNYKGFLLLEQDIVDSTLATLSSNLVSLAMLLGTLTVAAVPALFTGYSIYSLTLSTWGEWMAVSAGWVFGIGLETVGMVTSNVALKLYRAWREGKVLLEEFLLTLVLMLAYVATVVLVILYVENLPVTLQAVGVGSPFLTVVLYIARGLYLDHANREAVARLVDMTDRQVQQQIDQEERQHRREIDRLRLENQHQRKLEKLRLESQPETKTGPENLPENSGNLPAWLPEFPRNLNHFRLMVETGQIILPPGLTGADLEKDIPTVGTDRTGRNWLEAVGYRNGNN
jgi:hypothetical protein